MKLFILLDFNFFSFIKSSSFFKTYFFNPLFFFKPAPWRFFSLHGKFEGNVPKNSQSLRNSFVKLLITAAVIVNWHTKKLPWSFLENVNILRRERGQNNNCLWTISEKKNKDCYLLLLSNIMSFDSCFCLHSHYVMFKKRAGVLYQV